MGSLNPIGKLKTFEQELLAIEWKNLKIVSNEWYSIINFKLNINDIFVDECCKNEHSRLSLQFVDQAIL